MKKWKCVVGATKKRREKTKATEREKKRKEKKKGKTKQEKKEGGHVQQPFRYRTKNKKTKTLSSTFNEPQ